LKRVRRENERWFGSRAFVSWPTLIRNYRHDRGLSAMEFSQYFGVSRQTVYFWESGHREAPYRVTQEVLDWMTCEFGKGD